MKLGGPIAQAGAIRWGIAWALRSFVDEQTIERMRLGKIYFYLSSVILKRLLMAILKCHKF